MLRSISVSFPIDSVRLRDEHKWSDLVFVYGFLSYSTRALIQLWLIWTLSKCMCVFSWYAMRNDKSLVHYTRPVVFMATRAERIKIAIVNEWRLEMVSEGGDNCLRESLNTFSQTILQMLRLSLSKAQVLCLSNAQQHSPISCLQMFRLSLSKAQVLCLSNAQQHSLISWREALSHSLRGCMPSQVLFA